MSNPPRGPPQARSSGLRPPRSGISRGGVLRPPTSVTRGSTDRLSSENIQTGTKTSSPSQSTTETPPASSSSSSAAVANAPSTNEESSTLVQSLQAQVKDLTEKLETIMIKRQDDRVKLKEYEKCKIQLEMLENHKKQMTESQSNLNKQLSLVKREAKEATEALAKKESEVHELEETAEMATLDKEMAEEKCENLEREIEQLKEKLEIVTIDYEIMKSELDNKETPRDASGQGVTSYQVSQLESKNEKLTEALIKLRDLSIEDKGRLTKALKELEKYKSECEDLRKAKETLQQEVIAYEDQINDLKDQVDSNLASHQIVERLSGQVLDLEEKLSKMTEDQEILEKLIDANEQIVEVKKASEQELMQERDLLQSAINRLEKEMEASKVVILDYEATVSKFRGRVADLVAECDQLKHAQKESINAQEKQLASKFEHEQENIEYKIRLKEQKVKELEEQLTKAIEKHASYEEQIAEKNEQLAKLNGALDSLKISIDEKDGQISNLKKGLKSKMDELSEAVIRRDLAEKKLSNACKDSDEKGVQLQDQVEKLQAQLEAKKKEYEETCTHLQADVERAESQAAELKSRLKQFATGKVSTRMPSTPLGTESPFASRNSSMTTAFGTPSISSGSCQVGSALEESYIQQINSLKRVISLLRHQNNSLTMQENLKKLSLTHSYHHQANNQSIVSSDGQICRLRKEISALERKSASLLLSLRVTPMSSKEKREMGVKSAQLSLQLNSLHSQLNHLMNPLGSNLPSNEIIAKLTVGCDVKSRNVPVAVSLNQLRSLQASLLQ